MSEVDREKCLISFSWLLLLSPASHKWTKDLHSIRSVFRVRMDKVCQGHPSQHRLCLTSNMQPLSNYAWVPLDPHNVEIIPHHSAPSGELWTLFAEKGKSVLIFAWALFFFHPLSTTTEKNSRKEMNGEEKQVYWGNRRREKKIYVLKREQSGEWL